MAESIVWPAQYIDLMKRVEKLEQQFDSISKAEPTKDTMEINRYEAMMLFSGEECAELDMRIARFLDGIDPGICVED